MKKQLIGSAILVSLAAPAAAQVQPVALESFEYGVPGLLINGNGGSGWSSSWNVTTSGNEIVVFDQTINPPFASADAIGAYIGQASEFGQAIREVDNSGHGDVTEGGDFGKDGATMWFSFSTVAYQVFGDHLGGMYLYDQGVEKLFIGSPWATYEWGVDDLSPGGTGVSTIAGTDVQTDARLVVRIDHMAGDERLRMWLNPVLNYPVGAADIDVTIPDLKWSEVRFTSGGSASHYFWDDVRIEKGTGSGGIGTNYCGPGVPNTTGLSGIMSAAGSTLVSAMDLTLVADQLPPGQFAFFIGGKAQGFIPMPGGSMGNLCIVGTLARFNAQLGTISPSGSISIVVDTTAIPANPAVPIVAGETWNFQLWHRDWITGQGATSNFSDAVSILFQ